MNGNATGGNLSVGYQYFYAPTGRISGYIGMDIHDTTASPAIYGHINGLNVGPRVEADLSQQIVPALRFEGIGSYVAGTEEYWTRCQLLYTVAGPPAVGPEAVAQGNRDYDEYRLGAAVTGIPLFADNVTGGVDAGYAKIRTESAGVYGLFNVAVAF